MSDNDDRSSRIGLIIMAAIFFITTIVFLVLFLLWEPFKSRYESCLLSRNPVQLKGVKVVVTSAAITISVPAESIPADVTELGENIFLYEGDVINTVGLLPSTTVPVGKKSGDIVIGSFPPAKKGEINVVYVTGLDRNKFIVAASTLKVWVPSSTLLLPCPNVPIVGNNSTTVSGPNDVSNGGFGGGGFGSSNGINMGTNNINLGQNGYTVGQSCQNIFNNRGVSTNIPVTRMDTNIQNNNNINGTFGGTLNGPVGTSTQFGGLGTSGSTAGFLDLEIPPLNGTVWTYTSDRKLCIFGSCGITGSIGVTPGGDTGAYINRCISSGGDLTTESSASKWDYTNNNWCVSGNADSCLLYDGTTLSIGKPDPDSNNSRWATYIRDT